VGSSIVGGITDFNRPKKGITVVLKVSRLKNQFQNSWEDFEDGKAKV